MLRNAFPALPCCKEQVLRWTQERKERQRGERERERWSEEKKSSTYRTTVPGDSDRLKPQALARHTLDTDTHFVSPSFFRNGADTHTYQHCHSRVQGGLCLFGTALSLSGSITELLHNGPYHILIHLSATLIWIPDTCRRLSSYIFCKNNLSSIEILTSRACNTSIACKCVI